MDNVKRLQQIILYAIEEFQKEGKELWEILPKLDMELKDYETLLGQ